MLGSVVVLGVLAFLNAWVAYVSARAHPFLALLSALLALLLVLAAIVLVCERDRLAASRTDSSGARPPAMNAR